MLNNVQLQGRLTSDPSYSDKKGTCTFRIAVERDYKDSDGNRGVDFIPIIAFNKLGEIIEDNFKKGDEIIVVGRLSQYTYEDDDGETRNFYNVICEKMYFGRKKKEEEKEKTKNKKKK